MYAPTKQLVGVLMLSTCMRVTETALPTKPGPRSDNTIWLCDPNAPTRAAACPKPSDVMLRTETPHYTLVPPLSSPCEGDGCHMYDTWSAVEAFAANRLDWVYTYNRSFVAEDAPSHGIRAVSAAINANLPDKTDGPATYKIGRILNIHGKAIGAPWMQAWNNPPNYGCINNPDYIQVAETAASAVLDTTATGVQHDDAATNGGASMWAGGNPNASGCYCDHCMAGFTTAVLQGSLLNVSTRSRLNFTEKFNYKSYLFAQNLTDRNPPSVAENRDAALLRSLFEEFQVNSSEHYVTHIRDFIQTKKPGTPLSCNNGGRWTSPYFLCDYGLGELSKSNANPGSLEYIYHSSVPEGHFQVMTMPKAANISSADTNLVRWSIAAAYALGNNMIVPWDIYLPTPKAIRYFGSAAQYADIFHFVRNNTNLFDGTHYMQNIIDPDSNSSFELVHTGAGGDGIRFELPNEKIHPSNGTCPTGRVNLPGCEWYCNQDDNCAAIYYSDAESCCVLYEPLVTINHTSLIGDSYVRTRANDSRKIFASNSSTISLFPRSTNTSTIVLHAVDWGYTFKNSSSATEDEFVSIVMLNQNVSKCESGTLLVTIAGPNLQSSTTSISCKSVTSSIQIPLPKPWVVVHLKSCVDSSND